MLCSYKQNARVTKSTRVLRIREYNASVKMVTRCFVAGSKKFSHLEYYFLIQFSLFHTKIYSGGFIALRYMRILFENPPDSILNFIISFQK